MRKEAYCCLNTHTKPEIHGKHSMFAQNQPFTSKTEANLTQNWQFFLKLLAFFQSQYNPTKIVI